jgi:hypothetical protein
MRRTAVYEIAFTGVNKSAVRCLHCFFQRRKSLPELGILYMLKRTIGIGRRLVPAQWCQWHIGLTLSIPGVPGRLVRIARYPGVQGVSDPLVDEMYVKRVNLEIGKLALHLLQYPLLLHAKQLHPSRMVNDHDCGIPTDVDKLAMIGKIVARDLSPGRKEAHETAVILNTQSLKQNV